MSTAQAEQLRDEGMAAVTHAADPRLILTVDAMIAELNATGERWSANDVRDRLPVVHPNLIGARVRAAAMRKPTEQVKVDRVRSTLASTHSAEIAVWIGVTA